MLLVLQVVPVQQRLLLVLQVVPVQQRLLRIALRLSHCIYSHPQAGSKCRSVVASDAFIAPPPASCLLRELSTF